MILFEDAYKKVTEVDGFQFKVETVELLSSNTRILAEDAISDVNMPPFDKAAMDGYACRKQDIENELSVLEVIQAGKVPQKKISANQCSKIMTGAMLPEGADTIIIVEDVDELGNEKIKFRGGKNHGVCSGYTRSMDRREKKSCF